jgi:hypothetical protein
MNTHANKTTHGWILIAIVLLFVALVLGIYVWKKQTRPIVGRDNCVYEDAQLSRRKPSDYTVIIVDQSETLSDSHKRQVTSKLFDYLADDNLLPVGSVVMLYVFGKNDFVKAGAGQKLAPNPFLCKPASTGNEITENARKISRVFHNQFVVPMNAAIGQSLEPALGERSPILEMIQYVSRSQDIKEEIGGKHKKTLIIVSDLLQHSEQFSHYKNWTYEQFAASAGQLLRADLRGWDIRLLYLQRYGQDRQLQSKNQFEFWERYFYDSGAKIVAADRIP